MFVLFSALAAQVDKVLKKIENWNFLEVDKTSGVPRGGQGEHVPRAPLKGGGR